MSGATGGGATVAGAAPPQGPPQATAVPPGVAAGLAATPGGGAGGVAGERTVSEVAGDRRTLVTRTQGAVLIGFAGVGLAVFLGLRSPPERGPDANEQARADALRVAQRGIFEPARIPPPPPPPEPRVLPAALTMPPPLLPRDVAPPNLGPALGAPGPQAADPLAAARRAPVMAFGGSGQSGGGAASPARLAGGGGGGGSGGLGGPEEGNELAARLQPTRLEGVRANVLRNRPLLVTMGTVIPCVLETAIDSTLPGFATCTLPRDVLGSTGTVVLMEKGTRIVGEFRGGMRQGQRRLFVLWTRAETPTGVVVNLNSPATDALGRAGFDGDVDTRFWDRFGGALLLSLVDAGVTVAGDVAGDEADRYGRSAASAGRGAAAEAVRNTVNIPPVLRKNQGEQVAIFVARDLDFSSVYTVDLTGSPR